MIKTIESEIAARKFQIVKFLLNLFWGSAVLALTIYLYKIVNREEFSSVNVIVFITIIAAFSLISFLRFFYLYKDFRKTFTLLYIFLTLAFFSAISSAGTYESFPYLFLTAIIVAAVIILGVRIGSLLLIISAGFVLTIYLLNTFQLFGYSHEYSNPDIYNTIMNLVFLAIIGNIGRIGYDQIEHSYQKAFIYSKKLELLNRQLEKKVELRTRQLKESFDQQVESVHNTAVIGGITRPMLHDIATPLSALTGMFNLIDKKSLSKAERDLLKLGEASTQSMAKIIDNSRKLMKSNETFSRFTPYEVINNVLLILKTELTKNNIVVKVEIPRRFSLKGMAVLFERILINLILNATEELSKSRKTLKTIKIIGREDQKNFILTIEDNGRGIPAEDLEKIFEPDFSLKSNEDHLGLGLTFVRTMLEKKFRGKIEVASEVGKYTRFMLYFKKDLHAPRTSTDKSN